MLESIVLLVCVGAWAMLSLLAFHVGHDSRDGIARPADGPLWRRQVTRPRSSRQRVRRNWGRVLGRTGLARRSPRPTPAAFAVSQHRANALRAGGAEREGKDGRYAVMP